VAQSIELDMDQDRSRQMTTACGASHGRVQGLVAAVRRGHCGSKAQYSRRSKVAQCSSSASGGTAAQTASSARQLGARANAGRRELGDQSCGNATTHVLRARFCAAHRQRQAADAVHHSE